PVSIVERAVLREQVAGDFALAADIHADAQVVVVVRPGRNGHDRCDERGARDILVRVRRADGEPVAGLELDREFAVDAPALDATRPVLDVIGRSRPGEFANRLDGPRSWAESEEGEALADVAAPNEPDFRIEAVAHAELLELHTVPIP